MEDFLLKVENSSSVSNVGQGDCSIVMVAAILIRGLGEHCFQVRQAFRSSLESVENVEKLNVKVLLSYLVHYSKVADQLASILLSAVLSVRNSCYELLSYLALHTEQWITVSPGSAVDILLVSANHNSPLDISHNLSLPYFISEAFILPIYKDKEEQELIGRRWQEVDLLLSVQSNRGSDTIIPRDLIELAVLDGHFPPEKEYDRLYLQHFIF